MLFEDDLDEHEKWILENEYGIDFLDEPRGECELCGNPLDDDDGVFRCETCEMTR